MKVIMLTLPSNGICNKWKFALLYCFKYRCDHVTGCVTTESGKTTTELFETSALFDPSRHFNTNGSTLNNLSGKCLILNMCNYG